jgi:large subunit ribosomal protein L10
MVEKIKKSEKKDDISTIPQYKKDLVAKIAEKIKKSNTVLIASTKGLPASQFQKIKKSLRGKAEVVVAKKSIVVRAIASVEKGALQNLKDKVGADVCLMFSDMDTYELAGVLVDNQSASKAKAGDAMPEDIEIEAGPTELIPGPAISELGAVGLKVKVENGKLAVVTNTVIAKEGDVIDDKVASVMGKLGIEPMKVGFIPVTAYDAKDDMVYTEIKIDKEGALASLREAVEKALGFAVNVGYTVKETIGYFIAKAGAEEKALSAKVGEGGEEKVEEKKEEKSAEEVKEEEKKDESGDEKKEEAKEDKKVEEEGK